MRRSILFSAAIISGLLVFTSCNNDDSSINNTMDIPYEIKNSFSEKFPNAIDLKWNIENGYAIASFSNSSSPETIQKAWFDMNNHSWKMTKDEISYDKLPYAIKESFENSIYAVSPWIKDNEVDILIRNNNEKIYIIEVEQNINNINTEVDLYFTEDGLLIKEICNGDNEPDFDDYIPINPSSNIYEIINNKYPNAKIIDIDSEKGGYEIEIIYNNKVYEVIIDQNYNWIYSKYEIRKHDINLIPQKIIDTLRKSSYFTTINNIDDIKYYETKSNGNYFCFELEGKFEDDVKVYINEDGIQIEEPENNHGNNSYIPIDTEISIWIENKYPGSIIVEKDYDDGFLEVEIIYNGIKKEISFNGKNEWQYTKWEIKYNTIPEIIKATIRNHYTNYRIEEEDIEVIENNKNLKWYEIELENIINEDEIKVCIKEDGTIIKEIND